MKLMEVSKQGPVCKFGDAHIFYALHILDEEGKMSRSALSQRLEIGEGSARSIVTILKDWGLIEVRQSGITLTEAGKGFLEDTPLNLVQAPYADGIPGQYQQGIIVRGMAGQVTNGMDQRDTAVIAGATGASVFYIEDESLMVSSLWDKNLCDAELSRRILGSMSLEKDDVLLITAASRPDVAAMSAIAAGLEMI